MKTGKERGKENSLEMKQKLCKTQRGGRGLLTAKWMGNYPKTMSMLAAN